MTTPRFSIIMATIGAPELKDVIKNFLQSTQPLELVIMVDNPDCDTATLAYPEHLSDERLRLIRNDVNIGLTKSLNKAIKLTKGDIMVRCDDDDIPAPERMDELAAFFDAHPPIDIVYSHAQGEMPAQGKSWVIDGPTDDRTIKERLLQRNFIVHSSIAFRKASLEPIGFYDETFRFAQDYDLYLRCIRANLTFGGIPKVLVTRYYHDNSITVSKRKRQILHSMSARLLHTAQSGEGVKATRVLLRYAFLLLVPNWARDLRRRLGYGK